MGLRILKGPVLLSTTLFLLFLIFSYHFLDVNEFFEENRSNKKNNHDIPGPIKTVVLVVMENRSFDHMLGWLSKHRPDIDGLKGHESNKMNVSDPESPEIFVSDDASYVDLDPGHSFEDIYEQIFGSNETSAGQPQMSGFVQQAQLQGGLGMAKSVMSAFDPSSVPVYTSLADEFAIFDRWFASVPASTQPNRLFVHSATSHGLSSNIHFSADLLMGLPQKTIFDSIDEDGLSFGIYYQNIPAVLFLRSLRRLKHMNKFHSYKHAFKEHARRGTLPNYAVIEQHYFDTKNSPANDDHPSHDVSEGQKFIKEIYETLRASPQWNESALVITYDEHGGFYDHVPTPVKGVPSPDGILGPAPFHFKFDRLGVRVPTLIVSPWIEKRTVIHEPDGPTPTSQFEHSSLPATVKKLFNLSSDYLTKRDAWAGTFEKYFTMRDSPRTDCPEKLPEVKKNLRPSGPKEDASLSQFQKEMMALASKLSGDRMLQKLFDETVNSMDVGEASRYANKAVETFWKREMKRLKLSEMHQASYRDCMDLQIRKLGLVCL